ncbi:unnamed protein product [Sphenostylis stenocarpa]|uniref:Uncharacterized protein n=1 Tax=Sphenostylis stenocarpa TaxID=92480 RepID=A0AA86S9Z7_9FABA|nr:unnamed protein product [Sphenostylis stenocarpa]
MVLRRTNMILANIGLFGYNESKSTSLSPGDSASLVNTPRTTRHDDVWLSFLVKSPSESGLPKTGVSVGLSGKPNNYILATQLVRLMGKASLKLPHEKALFRINNDVKHEKKLMEKTIYLAGI